MSHHTLSSRAMPFSSAPRASTAGRFARFVVDRYLLLPLGAAIALLWANTAPESYFGFAQRLRFAVNDIAMALFFGLLAQEIFEEVMPGGALHTWRRWAVPVAAAIGGTVVAPLVFLLYLGLAYEWVLASAWPVACAVDLVASYYVLKAIGVPRSVVAFAMVMAIVANGIALAVLAPRESLAAIGPAGALLVLGALAIAALMRRLRVASFSPYLVVCGTMSWFGLYLSGLQPALALVPIVLFLPHEARQLRNFPDTPDDDATHHVEHEWNEAVQVVLFLFGLVNAGVLLRGYGSGTWALVTAALAGRPVGALAGVALALAAGLPLPSRIGWRDLVVVAFATSSGFTLALFFAVGIVAPGPALAELKIGALAIGAGAGAALTFAAAAVFGVGRFAHRRRRAG